VNGAQDRSWVEHFLLTRYFRDAEEDVNLHKWYQSEKEGHDVGWDRALVDWNAHIAHRFFLKHPVP